MKIRVLVAGLLVLVPLAAEPQRTHKPPLHVEFRDRTMGPVNAIMVDRKHGTFWGASSNHGEDHGIGW